MDETLANDRIYNGADDNASGVSAVLQIARAFLATGQKPLRTVIFAFWDGEEKGLLGSKYFVQSCPFISQVKGYLNFDMIGRNNKPEQPQHVVYFYTAAHPVFGDWLKQDIARYSLRRNPDSPLRDRPREEVTSFFCPVQHPHHLVPHRRTSRLSPAFGPHRSAELGENDRNNQSSFPQRLESCQRKQILIH